MKLLRRMRYLLHRRQADLDLAEEMEFHRAMSGGAELGNTTLAREEARAVWIWPWLEGVAQDLAYAVRNLRRSPGFALVALLTLGTAIGLNTSFFTVFNAIALRTWAVADPAHVVKIYSVRPQHGAAGLGVAEARYDTAHARSFAGIAAVMEDTVRFGFEAFGAASRAALVTGDHFRILGVGMRLGRGFLPEEDRIDAPEAVAILSYPYWRDHFGSDASIVGKQVTLDEVRFTVVGVTPESFTGTSEGAGREDVYLPFPAVLLLHPAQPAWRDILTQPDQCCVQVLGRLAPGASRTQAAAELDVLHRQFHVGARPDRSHFVLSKPVLLDNPGRSANVTIVFGLLFAGVTMVLLLACANVGNLLNARAGARQKEIEIRRAIGAGRARIVRQLMTESVLLALGAAILGIPLAYQLPRWLIAQTGEALSLHLTPDSTVLAYAIAMVVVACVGFGLAPALHGTRPGSGSRLRLRNVLLAVQVGLSVILLTGASLALQGVARLRSQNPGYAVDGVSVVSFEFPARDSDTVHLAAFSRRLALELKGGRPFGITAREPLSKGRWKAGFRLPAQPPAIARLTVTHQVTAGYFDVLHIPILAGRNFAPGDDGRNVIIINESLAHLYWQDETALGQTAIVAGRRYDIAGVVKDTYSEDLDQIEPTVYLPFDGTVPPMVLTSPAGSQAVAAVAARIEPLVRTHAIPLEANIERWFGTASVGAEVAGVFGIYALVLATIGMSGVFAYAVQQRTKEIGIRMALGARPGQVVRLVLGGSSRSIVIGIGIGLPGAFLAARLMRSVMYGVSPLDPIAYAAVACLLAAAGLAASYAPARRAARIDPLQSLRHE